MIMTIVRENLIYNREYVTNANIQIIKAQPAFNDRFEGIDISVPREGEEAPITRKASRGRSFISPSRQVEKKRLRTTRYVNEGKTRQHSPTLMHITDRRMPRLSLGC